MCKQHLGVIPSFSVSPPSFSFLFPSLTSYLLTLSLLSPSLVSAFSHYLLSSLLPVFSFTLIPSSSSLPSVLNSRLPSLVFFFQFLVPLLMISPCSSAFHTPSSLSLSHTSFIFLFSCFFFFFSLSLPSATVSLRLLFLLPLNFLALVLSSLPSPVSFLFSLILLPEGSLSFIVSLLLSYLLTSTVLCTLFPVLSFTLVPSLLLLSLHHRFCSQARMHALSLLCALVLFRYLSRAHMSLALCYF